MPLSPRTQSPSSRKTSKELRDKDSGYSVKEDKITDNGWDEALHYLQLLVDFVDATKHLAGTEIGIT